MKFCKQTENDLINLAKSKKIFLEGNIIKVVETDNLEFKDYITQCNEKDKESRKRRLDITKQIQSQNKELILAQEKNSTLMEELKISLAEAEKLRDSAVEDLDTLQKRTQFELISTIVKVALAIIISIGFIVTVIYFFAILYNKDTQIIGSTWSNLLGILLTNAFSIVGTIMGVKYATDNK
jgi:hypothetical protein